MKYGFMISAKLFNCIAQCVDQLKQYQRGLCMRSSRSVVLSACLVFTCVAARAKAQTKEEQECSDIEQARQRAVVADVRTPEHEPLPDAEHGTHWYGWQTLTADGLSLLAVPVAGAGVFSFLIATPIIHLAHGQASASAVSVGMRVVGTALPAGLWLSNCFELDLSGASLFGDGGTRSSSQVSNSSSSEPICDAVLPGLFFVGLVGSITLDAAVFAYEPVPDALRSTRSSCPGTTPQPAAAG